MQVSKLIAYPVKSLGGVSMDNMLAQNRGFQFDRRWVITDDQGKFITQREIPTMSLIKPEWKESSLFLRFKSELSPDLLETEYDRKSTVKVWGDTVSTEQAGGLWSEWLSDQLGQRVQLHHLTDATLRSAKRNGGQVSFADRWPYLILSSSSVEDLNKKLTQNTNPENFRPNIVVDSIEPYIEETWQDFTVGNLSFKGEGPCGRCRMINIDQETAETKENILEILSGYRKLPNKIPMGLQARILEEGMIHVGDEIVA